jgi:hypothetical protein
VFMKGHVGFRDAFMCDLTDDEKMTQLNFQKEIKMFKT